MIKSTIIVNEALPQSKYKQIVNSVIDSVLHGRLRVGDKLPSINSICRELNLSRDTVLNAYSELKARGIVSSAAGKGYFVATQNVNYTHKIFVLFDELNPFKETLYNAFIEELGSKAEVDIYFHHFNRKEFDRLLNDNNGLYTTYVVMPTKFSNTIHLLNSISGRVILLDQVPVELKGKFPSVYQNFEKDTYNALKSGKKLLAKYNKLIMVYPGGKEPEGQFQGFIRYCNETNTPFELLSDLNNRKISKGEAYIVIWDRDLVKLVNLVKSEQLSIGNDIGIVSYNDTELKQIVANGITTISTDFTAMGRTLAGLVLSKSRGMIENPSSLIVRGSL